MKPIVRALLSFTLPLVALICLYAISCTPVTQPSLTEPPSPEGAGWITWNSEQYKGQITATNVSLDTIALDVTAIHNNGCTPRTSFTYAKNGNTFTVRGFLLPSQTDAICTQALTPFTLKVRLPVPSPGAYRVVFMPSPLDRAYDTTFTVR